MRYLGIDFGTKKIGVSVSDDSGNVAFPLRTLKNKKGVLEDVKGMVEERGIGVIVIGEPRGMGSAENRVMAEAKAMAKEINDFCGVPVVFEPEWYTTAEAKRVDSDVDIDARAATIILQSYLDRMSHKRKKDERGGGVSRSDGVVRSGGVVRSDGVVRSGGVASGEQTQKSKFAEKIGVLKNYLARSADNFIGRSVLGLISFLEAIFFPVPPDFFLVPMVLSSRKSWFLLAIITTIGSVLGGLASYGIGFLFQDFAAGLDSFDEYFAQVEQYTTSIIFLTIIVAFTPIPYKVFAIIGGFLGISLIAFFIGSLIGRATRFLLVAFCASLFGTAIFDVMDKKYRNHIYFAIILLIVLGAVFYVYHS
ncbi:MAG: Holliday junction resolvase RuvX [Candidatus Campbellbacteria bacterium]|nr:Holliday junction resolvase RuvX [Candidatus Campbellbacteria bacterium]